MKNWKTTSAGIISIVGGAVTLYYNRHQLTEAIVMGSVTAIISGIGLIFAKDANVTGGTQQ